MGEYAKKTCYDCGIREPANMMQRVEESYNSGRSDNRVTGGNLAFSMFSDTAAKKVKRTVVANNRRSYTRNRTVWKCLDCSGHNAAVAEENYIKEKEALRKAKGEMGGFGKFFWWVMLLVSTLMLCHATGIIVVEGELAGNKDENTTFGLIFITLFLAAIELLFDKPRRAKKKLTH